MNARIQTDGESAQIDHTHVMDKNYILTDRPSHKKLNSSLDGQREIEKAQIILASKRHAQCQSDSASENGYLPSSLKTFDQNNPKMTDETCFSDGSNIQGLPDLVNNFESDCSDSDFSDSKSKDLETRFKSIRKKREKFFRDLRQRDEG